MSDEIEPVVTSSEVQTEVPKDGGTQTPAPQAESSTATGEETPKPEEAKPEEGTEKSGDDEAAKERRRERLLKNRLYREAAQHRAAAEQLRAENEQLRKSQQQPAQPPDPTKPKHTDYLDENGYIKIAEYDEAVRRHAVANANQTQTAEQQARAAQIAQQRLKETWAASVTKGEEKYDDFFEKVGHLEPNMPWSIAMMRSPNGHDVAYHLATQANHEDIKRIGMLDPVDQIAAIGALSAKLATAQPKQEPASKAPPPITPVGGSPVVKGETPSDEDDIDTWMKKENIRTSKRAGL